MEIFFSSSVILADIHDYNTLYHHAILAEDANDDKLFDKFWRSRYNHAIKIMAYSQVFNVPEKVLFDFARIIRKHKKYISYSRRNKIFAKLINHYR